MCLEVWVSSFVVGLSVVSVSVSSVIFENCYI